MTQEILLVDDEEGIRKVLAIALTDSGYNVHKAESGAEALRIFREKKPPIVMTDIKMPGMDGIELLRKIKEESPDTEVIMITGHGDMELAIQSLKFDATDFITKPIHDDVLEIALRRAKEKIYFKAKLKDYTENLERLVEEKTEKLLEAERLAAIGQTVAGLAHAIKNIAGGLTGGTFVLEKGIELENRKYLHQVPYIIIKNKKSSFTSKDISVFFGRHHKKLESSDWRKYSINWNVSGKNQVTSRKRKNMGELYKAIKGLIRE